MKTKAAINTASLKTLGWILMSLMATQSWAFDSGSTGADGAFSPTADTGLAFPANGILNFTTLNIPSGVTVNVGPNPTNGPAVILVQGDAVIDGVIDISGADGEGVGSAPAGFAGGLPLDITGGTGQGPGGSAGGNVNQAGNGIGGGGNGGSYGSLGATGTFNTSNNRGPVYGSNSMKPLLGGSGGGGTGINATSRGYRGGGGGGGGGISSGGGGIGSGGGSFGNGKGIVIVSIISSVCPSIKLSNIILKLNESKKLEVTFVPFGFVTTTFTRAILTSKPRLTISRITESSSVVKSTDPSRFCITTVKSVIGMNSVYYPQELKFLVKLELCVVVY